MTTRTRWRALVAVIGVVVLATTAYVAVEAESRRGQTPAVANGFSEGLSDGPLLVFRNTTIDGTNGEVAAVPLTDPAGQRSFLGPECDRVDVIGDRVSCLRTNRGLANTYKHEVYDDGDLIDSWPVPGIPSRTRLSPSGRLVASTVFVAGHSYMQSGFSTVTTIREVSGHSFGNLETWTLFVDGEVLEKADRNFWGVTFVDDRRFYATAASATRTWLVAGDLEERTLTALRANAECPAVSPDHRKIAYKKRTQGGAHWSIAVLDLDSGTEAVLAEERHVDDQVTWLDDGSLLYGMPREQVPGVTDVWQVGIEPEDQPRLVIENAWSPAVTL